MLTLARPSRSGGERFKNGNEPNCVYNMKCRASEEPLVDPQSFINIDEESISLRQAVDYLRTAGELPRFIQTVLNQHLLAGELRDRPEIAVDPNTVEQAMVNFRIQNRLNDPEQFDRWLASQNLTYNTFRDRVSATLKLEALKEELIGSQAKEYFQNNKENLDRVVLSRLVVGDAAFAQDLRQKIIEGIDSFESLVKAHSLTNDRNVSGLMGALQMSQLPEPVRLQLKGRQAGDLVGPIEEKGNYALLRIEQWQPASFQGNLKRQLQEQFFGRWVQQQLQGKKIQMHFDNE